jgi:hypothetical protein
MKKIIPQAEIFHCSDINIHEHNMSEPVVIVIPINHLKDCCFYSIALPVFICHVKTFSMHFYPR